MAFILKEMQGGVAATFVYTDTQNHRYRVSSSRKKVDAFGNKNAADTEGVVVKVAFNLRSSCGRP